MFVLCPYCQFLVALDPASGKPPLRCTRCQALLVPAPEPAQTAPAATQPSAAEGQDPHPQSKTADATISIAASDHEAPDTPADPEISPPHAGHATAPADGERSSGVSTPGFVHRQRARIARAPRAHGWMIAAIVALSLLLVLQLLLADRAELARDARWRPALSTLCRALHCTLPPWRETAAFTLLDRDVRPRPDLPGVLHVTATFRNDARWPQPWPALLLTLSDLDGRAAGARVFAPREYLGATPVQRMLLSGQSATLAMDVVEPEPRIVAFTFDFR